MPFTHEIRVTWGDCDPACIAYTGRIPNWALDAINAWWEEHLGGGWFQMEQDLGFGTPFVHMSMDFKSPITPRHRLICVVQPVHLGNKSIEFDVQGSQDGILCFSGRFVSVFTRAGSLETQSPPADIRELVTAHLPKTPS